MPSKKLQSAQEPSFEVELTRLEALAERMENGELPLDELMAAFEEGNTIACGLQARLEKAKARLQEVKVQKDGTVIATQSTVAVQSSLLDELP